MRIKILLNWKIHKSLVFVYFLFVHKTQAQSEILELCFFVGLLRVLDGYAINVIVYRVTILILLFF